MVGTDVLANHAFLFSKRKLENLNVKFIKLADLNGTKRVANNNLMLAKNTFTNSSTNTGIRDKVIC